MPGATRRPQACEAAGSHGPGRLRILALGHARTESIVFGVGYGVICLALGHARTELVAAVLDTSPLRLEIHTVREAELGNRNTGRTYTAKPRV